MRRIGMKSYQKSLLIAAATTAIISLQQCEALVEKESDEKKEDKTPVTNRDWLVDKRKKNVEKKTCRECKHTFFGSRRRRYCVVCTPFEITKRLASEEMRSMEVRPENQ